MAVLTEQKRHPRVHVSPPNIIVAVAALLSLPPQHSPMFGHFASSQTVCRFKPRKSFLIFLKFSLEGIGVLSHDGSRVIVFLRPSGPTWAVLISYASAGASGASGLAKSPNEGPALRLSLNAVCGRGRLEGSCGSDCCGVSMVVANVRACTLARRSDCKVAEERRQRVLGIEAAIMKCVCILKEGKKERGEVVLREKCSAAFPIRKWPFFPVRRLSPAKP